MVRAGTHTDKAEDTRLRLLVAGADLFADHGYSATSLNDVVAAAGSTKGGFYFHFESKAALGLAVIEQARDEFRTGVLAATGEYGRASDQLVAMVRAIAEAIKAKPAAARIGRLCVELREEPEIAPAALNLHADWVALVNELLERARVEGDLDPAVDTHQAATYAVGAFVGVESLTESQAQEFLEAIDDHLRFTFRAIGLHSTLLDPS